MAANFVLLEKITVGAAGASSVTFNSIPQTGYTDLVLKISARTTRAQVTDAISLSINGSAANQTSRYLEGDGQGSTSSGSLTSFRTLATGANATSNTFGNSEYYFPNYTGSTFKSASSDGVTENNAAAAYAWLVANLWSSTDPITSITVTDLNSATFVQYSTFYLYGVAKLGTTPAIQAKATGGDIIETDGTYWYHAFLSSGTFTPVTGLSCDVLVVAGGASGSSEIGAGGGAGGVLEYLAQPVPSSAQTVTIGAGGASRSATSAGQGNNGSNSQFASLTASVGGGGGGIANASAGSSGGSGGGGGANQSGGPFAGGAGTSGQGNAGGTGGYSTQGGLNYWTAGGGGGKGGTGGVGGAVNFYTGGAGGAGSNTWSSWLSVVGLGVSGFIAGGGGGIGMQQYGGGSNPPVAGPAGSGGGGIGAMANAYGGTSSNATNATANTGSGGGGGGWAQVAAGNASTVSGQGGSGLVVVRYAV